MPEKATAQMIEDVMNAELTGETLKNALSFIAYLRENKINPLWSATNAWKITYKTFSVCFIRIHGAADYHGVQAGSWQITPFIGDYEGSEMSDELKEIVWTHQSTCAGCGLCALKLATVFGKEYDYACEKSIRFTNPSATELECIKKLIKLRRSDISVGNAKKHKYVPVRDRR